ncbi:hypothetical protein CspeluHIS016_0504410 [Cutaneotrichosporon spelunceum]|uniref:Uncharacterized protein n=1 Tax=Cutaneotrichosporon spelunceum TaxID=1672016 RepID=A0AAD3TX37_9TREE|nr:hypothetical protein CspeluHIS016_0504410 [Cutaneotrichosporon spelunceum]
MGSRPRPPPLRPTSLQRAALVLAGVLTMTMLGANVTLLAHLDSISWRYRPISKPWRPLLLAHLGFGATVLASLSVFARAIRKGGWRVRTDVLLSAALASTGTLLAALHAAVPWYQVLWVQDWECEGLGVPCTVTRFSIVVSWPIAALFAIVAVGEAGYVLCRHGRGAWPHTLQFLQAVPPEDLVDAQIYERSSRGYVLPPL